MWTIITGREREEPIAYTELADFTPWDTSTCNRRYKKYEREGKYADAYNRVAEVMG